VLKYTKVKYIRVWCKLLLLHKQNSSDSAALYRRVDKLQEVLEQATKGIVVLATQPASGATAQPNGMPLLLSVWSRSLR